MSILDEFFSKEPTFINSARWNHFLSLNLPIQNKNILEPGCGPGIFTQKFIDLSCNVYSMEARSELVKYHNANISNSKIIHFNLESEDWTKVPICDITFAYGILYHLKNPDNFIKKISEKTTQFCIIETALSLDNNNDDIHNVNENLHSLPQSFTGIGCRPTRRYIWNLMKKNFDYVYMPLTQPLHPDFPTQFNTSSHHTHRFIIIGSKIHLNNSQLSDQFIKTYNITQ